MSEVPPCTRRQRKPPVRRRTACNVPGTSLLRYAPPLNVFTTVHAPLKYLCYCTLPPSTDTAPDGTSVHRATIGSQGRPTVQGYLTWYRDASLTLIKNSHLGDPTVEIFLAPYPTLVHAAATTSSRISGYGSPALQTRILIIFANMYIYTLSAYI